MYRATGESLFMCNLIISFKNNLLIRLYFLYTYLFRLFLQVSDLVSNNCQFVASIGFDEIISLKIRMKCFHGCCYMQHDSFKQGIKTCRTFCTCVAKATRSMGSPTLLVW